MMVVLASSIENIHRLYTFLSPSLSLSPNLSLPSLDVPDHIAERNGTSSYGFHISHNANFTRAELLHSVVTPRP